MYLRLLPLIFAFIVASNVHAATAGRIALIFSASSKALNIPSLEFYQSVTNQFIASTDWQVISYQEVEKYLPRGKSNRLIPESIPSISRGEFLRAHPPASNNYGKRKLGKKGRLSKTIQELLDTLAADGAVVVDCIPSGSDRVRACGIYYYDRAASRVVASIRKDFKVGITDATRWSGVMVAGLHNGLAATKENKSKSQLEAILDKGPDDQPIRSYSINFDARGETSAKKMGSSGVAPALALGVATMTGGTGAGVEFTFSQQVTNADSDVETKWSGRRLGLFMTSEVEAQETMVWSLDIGLGISERIFNVNRGLETGSISQKEAYIAARPGLMWDLSKQKIRMGFVGDFTRFIGGKSESHGLLSSDTLPTSSRGLSFRIKYIF